MKRAGKLLRWALGIVLGSCALVGAETTKAPDWLVGKHFDQLLRQKTDFQCAHSMLSAVLGNLTTSSRIAIVLDRRIDPQQTLSLSIAGQPLADVLRQIAESEHLGVSLWEPIVYIGPAADAAALRTLAHLRREDVAALPAPRRSALLAVRPWSWNDLAEPRNLLSGLASEARVKIEGLDQIPHDLWSARRLPPLAWIDRLTLVAIQFGLTFEIAADGRTVRLIPLPPKVAARRSFPARRGQNETVHLLAERYPEAAVKVEGEQIVVDGRIEDLETIARAIVAPGRPVPKAAPAGRQVYKLSAADSLSELLPQLAKRLDLEFQLDRPGIERAGISLERVVTVNVEGVSLDELLAAVLAPAGLKGVRRGRTVTVTAEAAAPANP